MQTHLLSPVVEETRFVGLNDHNVKQVPPVLPYNVVHSSVPEKDKDLRNDQVSNILKCIMRAKKDTRDLYL